METHELYLQCDTFEQATALREHILSEDFDYRPALAYVPNPVSLLIGHRVLITLGNGFRADYVKQYCNGWLAGWNANSKEKQ